MTERLFIVGFCLFLAGAAGLCGEREVKAERAQGAQGAVRPLALALAKVAANECGLLGSERRCLRLVWQTVEHQADSDAGRLGWLRRHSGRVLERRPCYRGNCVWTRHLTPSGAIPAGLAASDPYWRHRLRPRWLGLLEAARGLVSGRAYEEPCHVPPTTWGSLNAALPDIEVARGRGLYPIGCEGSVVGRTNDGFRPLPGVPW